MTGNRSQRHAVPASPWKNPRQGGENTIDQIQDLGIEETPPPRRGRLVSAISGAVPRGNTPAEAGKTIYGLTVMDANEKHPRRGGEDRVEGAEGPAETETPPPRRGRQRHSLRVCVRRGNTPAEARKTTTWASSFHTIPETPPPRRGRQ